MKQKIKDALYSARWALTEAIDHDKYNLLGTVIDRVGEAQSLLADEDVAPSHEEPPAIVPEINDGDFHEPKFVEVPGVSFKKWKYKNGTFDVLLWHYTVTKSDAKTAVGVLKGLAKRGLGCMVMDEDGVIYIPKGFNIFTDAAAHAGLSKWNGFSGLNSYAAGIEVCNYGKLDSKTKKLARGVRASKGEANIIKGEYEPYTAKQESELFNFAKWAKSKNPRLKFENLCGHDEARALAGQPGGKSDPGASLSMTMPKARALLLKKG